MLPPAMVQKALDGFLRQKEVVIVLGERVISVQVLNIELSETRVTIKVERVSE